MNGKPAPSSTSQEIIFIRKNVIGVALHILDQERLTAIEADELRREQQRRSRPTRRTLPKRR